MSLRDRIAEAARQVGADDGWHVTEQPYVLELRYKGPWGEPKVALFQLPIGPEQYEVVRVFRKGIEPTLGGLVAEEQGLLWREITLSGTFGLTPRRGRDTSTGPEGAIEPDTALSGPAWTKRLIRNYIERYGELKANPDTSSAVLIWHDLKMGDHWVVVPDRYTTPRTTQRRMQYPYTFRLTAIGDAAAVTVTDPPEAQTIIDDFADGVARAKLAMAKMTAMVDETTLIAAEVTYYVKDIDSMLSDSQTLISALTDLTNGAANTLAVGADFLQSSASNLQEITGLLEAVVGLPDDVRQQYLNAMDAIDLVASTPTILGTSYASQGTVVLDAEQGYAGRDRETLSTAEAAGPSSSAWGMVGALPSTARELVNQGVSATARKFPAYKGYRAYTVTAGDTLQAIAARELGDAAQWYQLAMVNGLKAPYVSPAGLPGTVRPGQSLSIPVLSAQPNTGVASAGTGDEPGTDVLGTDVRLVLSSRTTPGTRRVTWAESPTSATDLGRVTGQSNLGQALQMRLWIQAGTRPLLPEYGFPRAIGSKLTQGLLAVLKLAVEQNLRADPRVLELLRLRLTGAGDVVEIEADILPVGLGVVQTVSLAP